MVRRDIEKLRELLLYIAKRSEGDPRFGVTRLMKALFWCDFACYRLTGEAITGSDYIKMPYGPMLEGQQSILESLQWRGALRIEQIPTGQGVQQRPVALRESDVTRFTPDELALVDRIVDGQRGQTASQVSDLSHEFLGWRVARKGERIPYGTALLSTPELTPEEIEFGLTLSRQLAAVRHGG